MKITVLASGSSGNAAVIEAGRTRVMVDAGLSKKRLLALLQNNETLIDPASLSAVLLTHEHSDHSAGAGALAAMLDIPIYLTNGTEVEMDWGERRMLPRLRAFRSADPLDFEGLRVESIAVPHDAAEPVGYIFASNGTRLGWFTDLGFLPEGIVRELQLCDGLFIEANHDFDMLKLGGHPHQVKQRVMGPLGHLSNQMVANFIRDDMANRVKMLIAGHLSEYANDPELVELALNDARNSDVHIAVVKGNDPPRVFFI